MKLIRIGHDKKLTLVNEVPAGGVPEAVAFSASGEYVYGNFLERNMQVYRIVDGRLTDTGTVVALPAGPVAMSVPTR